MICRNPATLRPPFPTVKSFFEPINTSTVSLSDRVVNSEFQIPNSERSPKSEGRNIRFGIAIGFESVLLRSRIVLLGLLVASQCLGADRIFRAGAAIVDITPT